MRSVLSRSWLWLKINHFILFFIIDTLFSLNSLLKYLGFSFIVPLLYSILGAGNRNWVWNVFLCSLIERIIAVLKFWNLHVSFRCLGTHWVLFKHKYRICFKSKSRRNLSEHNWTLSSSFFLAFLKLNVCSFQLYFLIFKSKTLRTFRILKKFITFL